MEYVAGRSLDDVLRTFGPFPEAVVRMCIMQPTNHSLASLPTLQLVVVFVLQQQRRTPSNYYLPYTTVMVWAWFIVTLKARIYYLILK